MSELEQPESKKGLSMNANSRYFVEDACVSRNSKEGVETLTNFCAEIKRELIYHDGPKHSTHLIITGRIHDDELDAHGERKYPEGKPLPEITVPASDFASLGWVADKWGLTPIIYPVASAERDLRTAIQLASKPEKEHIYTHTGWTDINGEPTYLSNSGGITRKGLNPNISVALPHELKNYELPAPSGDPQAFFDSLRLVNIGPPETMWVLLLACYRAAVGPVDFTVHLAGRTGTYKSELASLIQSHYGEKMHAKALPASWSSTANAVEALCYRAKNAIITLDDFVPTGTAWQVRQLQKTADQIVRGQGNQAGRSRLTDISQMQTTYYPRGLTLSTGEDVPEGHSVRGRMMILELAPGDIVPAKLTQAQQKRPQYPKAMADWIQWLAGTNAAETVKFVADKIRDKHLHIGHTRTPSIIGQLLATMNLLTEYAVERKYVTLDAMESLSAKAEIAVLSAANKQKEFLEAADPVEATLDTIRLLLGSQIAHCNTKAGGIPKDAEKYGWTKKEVAGGMPDYARNGPRLGWVDTEKNELLIDPNALTLIKKYSGGKLAITQQTLLKRMKEAGILTRTDDNRQRNTCRLMLEGHVRQALCMEIDTVFNEKDRT
jgi:hypothetical protein